MVKFVPRFIAGEFDPKFGSWRDNVLSWTSVRGDDPGFLLLRYEDMKRDTAGVLASVVAFLDRCAFRKIDSTPEALQRAIELSSAENMRALEKQDAGSWVLTKHTRSDKPFVRSATFGGWKTQLDSESVEAIESAWGSLMQELRYELTLTRTAISANGFPARTAMTEGDSGRHRNDDEGFAAKAHPEFFTQATQHRAPSWARGRPNLRQLASVRRAGCANCPAKHGSSFCPVVRFCVLRQHHAQRHGGISDEARVERGRCGSTSPHRLRWSTRPPRPRSASLGSASFRRLGHFTR